MTRETAVEALVEQFSESVGVEKATEMIGEALAEIGLSDRVTLGPQQVVEVCEIVQTEYGGYVEMIARDLEIRTQAERRFHALFEHIPDAAFIVEFEDDVPIVRTVNAAFEDVFGYEAASIVGEPANEYLVPPSERESATRIDRRAITGDRVDTEVRRRTASGDERDFLFRGVTVTTASGAVEGYGIYTDITDRKERERELERQNEQLDRFASVVSHDLRNPLSVAAGHLALARETGDLDYLDGVAEAHDRMERLIDRLLSLARQGQTVGNREPAELEPLVTRVWSTVETPAAALVFEDSLATVVADPDRLIQLFENLLGNALEHAGPSVTVTVGLLDTDDSGASRGFYVADDGPGIAEADREHVLEAGYTTAEGGTGLGLAIVRSIAEAHGWTLGVADGPGARFEVTGVEFES